VAEAARAEADAGVVYASHAYLPFNLPGYATAAYEIHAQLGSRLPGTVIVPVGQGGFLLGVWRGFNALKAALKGDIQLPNIIGVQAKQCDPLWRLFTTDDMDVNESKGKVTVAEGVNVSDPLRGEAVIRR
jgi:threonine synthase